MAERRVGKSMKHFQFSDSEIFNDLPLICSEMFAFSPDRVCDGTVYAYMYIFSYSLLVMEKCFFAYEKKAKERKSAIHNRTFPYVPITFLLLIAIANDEPLYSSLLLFFHSMKLMSCYVLWVFCNNFPPSFLSFVLSDFIDNIHMYRHWRGLVDRTDWEWYGNFDLIYAFSYLLDYFSSFFFSRTFVYLVRDKRLCFCEFPINIATAFDQCHKLDGRA